MKNYFTKKLFSLSALAFLLCWQVNLNAQGTCATAVTLTPGTQQCGDTADGGDTFDDNACLGSYDGGDDYLFVVTVPAGNDGDALQLDLTSGGSWTGIAISEGCPEGGGGTCFGASTSSSGNESLLSDALTGGNTYYIHISTWPSPQSATFCLDAAYVVAPTPPANDACANAISVVAGAGTASGSTALATDIEGLTPCSGGSTCGGGAGGIDFGAGVWFVYTSTVAEEITIDTDGSNFDTEIQVFEGSCGALICVGGDDDSGVSPSTASSICFTSSASAAAAPPGAAAASAAVDYYIYVDGHGTNTGNFVLNIGAAPLPVTLISFKGEKMENANKLSWITAVEENTEMHILERSVDGNRWSTIGKTEAQGFSYENKSYEMLDKDPLAKSFYRLKSLDFDGTFQYSEVISLERASEGFSLTRVFPVPSKGELSVEFNSKRNENVNVMITDMVGRVIFQDQFDAADGTNLYNTDMSEFAQGVYFISLNNGQETLTQRIIKN